MTAEGSAAGSVVGSAVVTGGARGIGREIAALLVQRGYAVVVTDVEQEAVRRTAAEIGAVSGLVQDVRDEEGHRAVAAAASEHGPLRAWFNNAGVGNDGTLAALTSAEVEQLVRVNLMGVLWGMRAALGAFGPSGGDIVNVASLSGLGPVPGLSVYAATKAAVVSLSQSVHVETPRNVRVHAVCPDGVNTAMVDAMEATGVARALVHSSGGLLDAVSVAESAVAMVGSSRVVRSLPGWRGGLVRGTSMAPSFAMKGLPLFVAMGRRAQRRR
ncbi:MAG TPA: SDR family NAD(P)-dependent oxidoreductase [Nocardioidaceae bacterium]|nr:SDR family NAD(P)-dependent oxidoreductase [Nocardioidaceae bacterium]